MNRDKQEKRTKAAEEVEDGDLMVRERRQEGERQRISLT